MPYLPLFLSISLSPFTILFSFTFFHFFHSFFFPLNIPFAFIPYLIFVHFLLFLLYLSFYFILHSSLFSNSLSFLFLLAHHTVIFSDPETILLIYFSFIWLCQMSNTKIGVQDNFAVFETVSIYVLYIPVKSACFLRTIKSTIPRELKTISPIRPSRRCITNRFKAPSGTIHSRFHTFA